MYGRTHMSIARNAQPGYEPNTFLIFLAEVMRSTATYSNNLSIHDAFSQYRTSWQTIRFSITVLPNANILHQTWAGHRSYRRQECPTSKTQPIIASPVGRSNPQNGERDCLPPCGTGRQAATLLVITRIFISTLDTSQKI